MMKESHVSVFVREMRVRVAIGLLDEEKKVPQDLLVSVEFFANSSYLETADEGALLDYAEIYKAVKQWETRPHTELLETYVKELLDMAFQYEEVTAARISIGKPDIFDEAQEAGVKVFMRRADWEKL